MDLIKMENTLTKDLIDKIYSMIIYEQPKDLLVQIKTFTLDPSLIGFSTTGNLNFFSIVFIKFNFFFSYEYVINFGVVILFLIKIFFEISLSIANDEATTPECV